MEQNYCPGCGQLVTYRDHLSDLFVSHYEDEEFESSTWTERVYHMNEACIRRRHPYLRRRYVRNVDPNSYSAEDSQRIEEFTQSIRL